MPRCSSPSRAQPLAQARPSASRSTVDCSRMPGADPAGDVLLASGSRPPPTRRPPRRAGGRAAAGGAGADDGDLGAQVGVRPRRRSCDGQRRRRTRSATEPSTALARFRLRRKRCRSVGAQQPPDAAGGDLERGDQPRPVLLAGCGTTMPSAATTSSPRRTGTATEQAPRLISSTVVA